MIEQTVLIPQDITADAPKPPAPDSKKYWFLRHKAVSGIGALALSAAIVNAMPGWIDATADATTPNNAAVVVAEEAPAAASVLDAADMEQAFVDNLGEPISSMKESLPVHWANFYDGVESSGGYFQVNLTTGDWWSESDLDALADATGVHWFNVVGFAYPDLDVIVVNINGVDHNVLRSASRTASHS